MLKGVSDVLAAVEQRIVRPGEEVLQAALTLTDPRVDQACLGDNVDLIAGRVEQYTVKPDEEVVSCQCSRNRVSVWTRPAWVTTWVWTRWAWITTSCLVLAMSWCAPALSEGTSTLDARVIHVQNVALFG